MARWSKKTPSGVQWPEGWDEGEGWPSVNGGETGLKREGRQWENLTWNHLHRALRLRASTLIEELGGPSAPVLRRTVEQCTQEILEYYKKTGKRPHTTLSSKWDLLDAWLQRRGSSLRRLCNELGLPGGYNFDRTMEQLKEELFQYHEKTGQRPNSKTSVAWGNWSSWLFDRGQSLRKICDELGLPSGRCFSRSIHHIDKEIRCYYRATGIRPAQRTSKKWASVDQWLFRQGTSLFQRCNKLGLK